MNWSPTNSELVALLNAAAHQRYEYMVKRVADSEYLYSLKTSSGWVAYGGGDGGLCIPVWPHDLYAAACATEEFAGAVAEPISLEEWLGKWTPGMIRDSRTVAVFPIPSGQAVNVSPEQFREDLLAALEWYGEDERYRFE